MCKCFQTELDFHSGQPSQTHSSEVAAFFDLTEDGLGFYRSVAPVPEPLFTCQQFSRPVLVIVKCMVHLYCGEWDSEEDFARHIVEECYDLERSMGDLARYFDYEAFGRELFMYDYSMGANNHVFRVI